MFGIRHIRDIFSEAVALDFGTVNTLAAIRGRGIVLREPTAVAISNDEEKTILEVGSKAMLMLGRTPGRLTVSYPMREGVITDIAMAEAMIRFCIEEALGRKAGPAGIRLALCLPLCVTDIERKALMAAAKSAGAREIVVLNEALAAAIGASVPVSAPLGSMVVDIGGGTTDAAVVVMGGIASHNSIRTGGTHIDRAIVDYIAKEHRLSIGERTAEQIKTTIGSALIGGGEHMQVRGRNLESGLPDSVVISKGEVGFAITATVRKIVNCVKDALSETPPELAGDVFTRGICLTGGGARLEGLAELVAKETGIPTWVAEDAEDCVVLGALRALDMREELEYLENSSSIA